MRSLTAFLTALLALAGTPAGAEERDRALAECRRAVERAAAGEVPPGAEKWGLAPHAFRAALSTIADPTVPLQNLEDAVARSLLAADPALADVLQVQRLMRGRPFILDETAPVPVPLEGARLLVRCSIRNYGAGWIPAELLIGRQDSGTWIGFPLTSGHETF